MIYPNLDYEVNLWKRGYTVIGVDEVGRGAFAGPLFVGGVVFPPTTNDERITKLLSYGINDSKKLSSKKRKLLSKVIQKQALAYHISTIEVPQINRIGIGKATFCAMRDVVCNLQNLTLNDKHFVLIDGFFVKYMKNIGLKNQQGIIGGDGISLSIAAASIIAKVARDEHMRRLSAKFPEYGWARNKGYGTSEHRSAITQIGPTPLHRTDFVEGYL